MLGLYERLSIILSLDKNVGRASDFAGEIFGEKGTGGRSLRYLEGDGGYPGNRSRVGGAGGVWRKPKGYPSAKVQDSTPRTLSVRKTQLQQELAGSCFQLQLQLHA